MDLSLTQCTGDMPGIIIRNGFLRKTTKDCLPHLSTHAICMVNSKSNSNY